MSDFEGDSPVPEFLKKLYHLVDNPYFDDVIGWDDGGKTFYVRDQVQFASEVLPNFFKHRNITSFIRQLNLYGFRKNANSNFDSIKYETDNEILHFGHIYFRSGEVSLLKLIKRKSKTDLVQPKGDVLEKVITDVNDLQSRQDDMTSKLENMKRENEVLWRELTVMRQKHSKQQHVVNKLVQFFGSLLGSARSQGMKRKMPLMIEAPTSSPLPAKVVCNKPPTDIDQILTPFLTEPSSTDFGPVIQDVTDNDTSWIARADISPAVPLDTTVDKKSGKSPETSQPIITYLDSPANYNPLANSDNTSLALQRSNSVHDMSDYMDLVDVNLSNLKDILGEQYHLDTSTINALFNSESSRVSGIESQIAMPAMNTSDNEITHYTDDLLNLPEVDDYRDFMPTTHTASTQRTLTTPTTPTTPSIESTLTSPSIDEFLSLPFEPSVLDVD